jgi:molybdopterin-guanine dinucleotide biosynthesis protein
MRVLSISGTQGSGKTTLIRELITRTGANGKQSAVIVNDDGEECFSQDFIRTHNLKVDYLRGG